MKKFLAILIGFAMVAFSNAAEQATLPTDPPTHVRAISATLALAAGSIILPLAILTGTREQLCRGMGGTYFPNSDGRDQCPGGQWSVLLGVGTPK